MPIKKTTKVKVSSNVNSQVDKLRKAASSGKLRKK